MRNSFSDIAWPSTQLLSRLLTFSIGYRPFLSASSRRNIHHHALTWNVCLLSCHLIKTISVLAPKKTMSAFVIVFPFLHLPGLCVLLSQSCIRPRTTVMVWPTCLLALPSPVWSRPLLPARRANKVYLYQMLPRTFDFCQRYRRLSKVPAIPTTL